MRIVLSRRSIFSLALGSRLVPRICSIRFSTSAGVVFGIFFPLAILFQPSHSGARIISANHYHSLPMIWKVFFRLGALLFQSHADQPKGLERNVGATSTGFSENTG